MTNFQYRNDKQLNKMDKRFFGETGAVVDIKEESTIKGYKYILAHCVVFGQKINDTAYEIVKEASLHVDSGLKNLIFFEKVKSGNDFIYFDEYMKEMEESVEFQKTWDALQEAAAA